MIKKILLPLLLVGFISQTTNAQSFSASFNYQSFRPFINFRLEIGNDRGYGYQDPYESAYIKGYMDGVNDLYYSDYRFYELVHNINAYEAGYRDGLRDRALLIRLKGYNRLSYRPFRYDDYYSPYYSVQIWLNELSFTFIQAPEYRLPRHWARRAHPHVKRYRGYAHSKRYKHRFKKYYKNRIKRLKKRSRYTQNRYRKDNRSYRNRGNGPQRLNRSRAIQRVKGTRGRSQSVRSRSNSGRVKSQSRRTYESKPKRGRRIEKSKQIKRSTVHPRSRGQKVKQSRRRGSKVKRQRSRRSKEKVERSRSRKNKGKKSKRGGSRKSRRGNN
ncbi:MAG: hypothetical protein JXR26_09190 [Balneolaceae bacterium]|nr:hypothetical protein [Balneolaceae bacterium]